MKYLCHLLLIAMPLCSAAVVPSSTENSVVQISVGIQTPNGPPNVTSYGTGFFINKDGLLVTASHVYLKAMNAIVDARSGVLLARRFSKSERTKWVAGALLLIAQDYAHDIVLLRLAVVDPLWKDFGGIMPLSLSEVGAVDDGTHVAMRGYFGADSFPVFLEGTTAGITELGPESVQELLIVMPVVPGQSGSPVIASESGRVIGVMTAIVPVALPFNQQPAHSGLARAIMIEHVKRLVESLPK